MSRVYFIRPVGMRSPVKIGCSQSPDTRLNTLDTWSPFALEIVAEIDGGFDLEGRFHALFADSHERREWFSASRRMDAVIAAINDGSFDVGKLPTSIRICNRNGGRKGRPISEAHRFSLAYSRRILDLRRGDGRQHYKEICEGHSWSLHKVTGWCYRGRCATADDIPAYIAAAEQHAAAMTAKYGHAKMKPVKWRGPYPTGPTDPRAMATYRPQDAA